MHRVTRALATLLATSVLIAGCGANTKKPEPVTPTAPPVVAPKIVDLDFYFPIALGGPQQKLIDEMVAEFNTANPLIKVTSTFAGNYQDTMTKVQTAVQGGKAPHVVVLQATDGFTLNDSKVIVPMDDYIAADKDGKEYIADFLPALMKNSKLDGKTWSVPFQRSTVVMYYNQDLFAKVGLTAAPKDWTELVSFGKKLTTGEGATKVWGLEIPSDGNPWVFSSLAIQAGKTIANEAGTEVQLNAPEVKTALDYMVGLAKTEKIMPAGIIKWGDTTTDFLAGKTAMIYHSTGSLGGLKKATFKFGVAPLPAGKAPGSPTGGGNIYIMKTDKEHQDASWKFIRFVTGTEQAAKWSVNTGYIATRTSAMETKTMKDAIAAFADTKVGFESLKNAGAEMATHNNQQIIKVFGDQIQAVISGQKDSKTALDEAQKQADTILKDFKK